MSSDLVKAESTLVPVMDSEAIKQFREIAENLRSKAETRRRKRTPKSIRKPLDVGGGRSVDIVDRPEYQRFLDDSFPGWSIGDTRFWMDCYSYEKGTVPILFNCQVQVVVIEDGIKRTVTGVGSAPVNKSELTRDTTTLLRFKYGIAYTNAIKSACNWLGAFFDLRADDERRADESSDPTTEQNQRYAKLRDDIPESIRETVDARWKKQTKASAGKFMDEIEAKLNERKATMEAANG